MKLSTKLSKIEKAITSKLKLKIKYNDIARDVEPHILGYDFDQKPVIRVYELSRANVITEQFKIYFVSNIQSIKVSSEKFTQEVTKSTDEAMETIVLTTYNAKKKEEKES